MVSSIETDEKSVSEQSKKKILAETLKNILGPRKTARISIFMKTDNIMPLYKFYQLFKLLLL